MKILIVTATWKESEPLRQALGDCIPVENILFRYRLNDKVIDLLVTGTGMVSTAYAMGQLTGRQKYDLAINAGICGSFNRNIRLGEVVNVVADSFADMGAEDNDSWLPMSKLGSENQDDLLSGDVTFNSNPGRFSVLLNHLRPVNGATVNTVHGNAESIRRFSVRTDAGIETMEGAAFMFALTGSDTKFIELRSVSNYVEPRNTDNWNIPLAIGELGVELVRLLKDL